MATDVVVQPAPGRMNNTFRPEDMEIYHGRALANVKKFTGFLLRNGVGLDAIQHADFSAQNPNTPEKVLQRFLESLPAERPDAVIYFAGHATRDGKWFFGWRQGNMACATVLTPYDFDINIAGERYIVSDAPGTAASWLSPSLRIRGIAGWTTQVVPNADISGSTLTSWLCEEGCDTVPRDALALEPAQEAGLRRLPCYEPLFWGAFLPESTLTESLWQLQSFALTGSEASRRAANTEFLLRGGPLILLKVLAAHCLDDAICLSCIRLLRSLVDHAPRPRWFGWARETLAQVLQILQNRELNDDGELLTEILGLVCAFSEAFTSCQELCTDQHWLMLLPLISKAIRQDKGEQCLRAGCALIARLATQPAFETFLTGGAGRRGAGVAVKRMDPDASDKDAAKAAAVAMTKRLEEEEGSKLLDSLISQTGRSSRGAAAAAEALTFAVLNRDSLKQRVLGNLKRAGAFKVLEKEKSANVCSRFLALLRALGSADFQVGLNIEVPPKAATAMILCMCRFPADVEVQRWGCAALGVFASTFPELQKPAVEGGPTCVLWALGAKEFTHNEALHQEALFCTHVLLRSEGGHLVFGESLPDLARLTALAADRSLRNKGEAGTEVVLWAMRVLEQLCYAPKGFWKVIAHAPVVTQALLHPSCTMGTINSGIAIISSLAVRYDEWRVQLKPDGAKISRMLQLRAWKAKALETDAGRELEVALRSWDNVLSDAISDPKAEEEENEDGEEEEEEEDEREEEL
eukprot:gnl/MRDRNA2_/MRDRNA2_90111_c0_seq1.p1 gnl/MRDRNA2_/MRDRNA2_90111_c0~~gnl/MRDRNA2_/MRDRNA2_90111_c0_seq1.p1  ORF type:complete len:812 (-),score=163.16 gnl/MRDRNA2_/MRDRNA2_90111_c0_seq1:137-2386(-)